MESREEGKAMTGCNHELCHTEKAAGDLTTKEVTFIMECLADQGILIRHGNDEHGEPVYSLAEDL